MPYTCPCCGYPNLKEDPHELSFEICPSCDFQFGYTDLDQGYNYEQWQQKWIQNGAVWDKGRTLPPPGWDPKKQLLNIGVKI